MADYFPILSRTISQLDDPKGEARRAMYERARAALIAQLRAVEPPLEESDITRERLALEEAIRKVEAEAARTPGQQAPAPKAPAQKPTGDPLAELARLIGETDPFAEYPAELPRAAPVAPAGRPAAAPRTTKPQARAPAAPALRPAAVPGKVFISYRRDDARYQAREIYKAFANVVPHDHVFMDIDSIRPGDNFLKILEEWVERCDILLALVGPGWISASDPKTGSRRLDNPKDFVRIEIRKALLRGIPVVPVILDGAPFPEEEALPDDLKELVVRHAEFVDFRTFDADVQRLMRKLGFVGRSAS